MGLRCLLLNFIALTPPFKIRELKTGHCFVCEKKERKKQKTWINKTEKQKSFNVKVGTSFVFEDEMYLVSFNIFIPELYLNMLHDDWHATSILTM